MRCVSVTHPALFWMDVTFQSQSELKKMHFGLICDLKWGGRICASELAHTQSKQ